MKNGNYHCTHISQFIHFQSQLVRTILSSFTQIIIFFPKSCNATNHLHIVTYVSTTVLSVRFNHSRLRNKSHALESNTCGGPLMNILEVRS